LLSIVYCNLRLDVIAIRLNNMTRYELCIIIIIIVVIISITLFDSHLDLYDRCLKYIILDVDDNYPL